MKHQGRDPRQALAEQELLAWFENEVADDALAGFKLTHVDLSADRSCLTLWYMPPDTEAAAQDLVQDSLAAHRWEVQDRVEDILRKRPEIRWREDKGAENQRRVESILEELRGEQGKDG